YLRSNTTRRQPWQIEEVSIGSRLAIAFGRFGADAAVMLAMLAVLTLSGFFLGWLILPASELNFGHIAFALWVVAAPALLGLAAVRILFDARPLTRGGFGDFLFFVLWTASIAMPAATEGLAPSFASNMYDFAGFVTPLTAGAPAGSDSFSIGGIELDPGFVVLDVFVGLFSEGYLQSRLAWAGIALAMVVVAGLIYAPHRPRKRVALNGRLGALLNAGPPPRVTTNAPPASYAFMATLGLVAAEFRLIGAGRVFAVLAVAAVVMAALVSERGDAGALLLLTFALSAHAGRSEARRLVTLTRVAAFTPMARRAAFVVAGTLWALVLNAPGLWRAPSFENIGVTAATGAGGAVLAIALAALTGSAFAPRIVLLVLWYAYISY
ncbi:MAG TPA: hypothetical protein VM915_07710, partial [Verrucomicrobiae bacterium]|nr:hypothetical protein [Verrucomicrobiae bacterium]